MNSVVLIGRLTREPEVSYTSGTQMAVAKFTIAIDDGYGEKKKTNFINCIVFGKTAENCEKFTGKGLRVAVEGKIDTGSYEKDGRKVYTTDIIVEKIEFIDWKNASDNTSNGDVQAEVPDGFAAIDEDVPF